MGIINTNRFGLQFNKLKPFILLLIELVFIICVILFDEHNMVKICFSSLAIIRLLLEKSFAKYKNEYNVFYITVIYCYFVYSTFNGMSNWLGTAFYGFFKESVLSLAWILIFISLGYIISVWKLINRHVTIKELIIVIVIAFIVDLSIWYPVSFESYYSGVEYKNKEVSTLMFNNTKLVLESGKSEKEKIEALEEIFGNYIWARLYKNNSIYFKTSFTRPKQVYTDKGLNATMDSIKESIGSKIHDFKNQWSNWEYNKIMSDGNIGACTKILLPLKEAKKDV